MKNIEKLKNNETISLIKSFIDKAYEDVSKKEYKSRMKTAGRVRNFLIVLTLFFAGPVLYAMYKEVLPANSLTYLYAYIMVLYTAAAVVGITYYNALKYKKNRTLLKVTLMILFIVLIPAFIIMFFMCLLAPKTMKSKGEKLEFVVASIIVSLTTILIDANILYRLIPFITVLCQKYLPAGTVDIVIALVFIILLNIINILVKNIIKVCYIRAHKGQEESITKEAVAKIEKLDGFLFHDLKLIVLFLISFGSLGIADETRKSINTAIAILAAVVASKKVRDDEGKNYAEMIEKQNEMILQLQKEVQELKQAQGSNKNKKNKK